MYNIIAFNIFQVAYCDSQNYVADLNKLEESSYLKFIGTIVESGTSEIYSQRADFIIRYVSPKFQKLDYGNSLTLCDNTVCHILNILLADIPSALEEISCSINTCGNRSERGVSYLTFQINKDDDLRELQSFINQTTKIEYFYCGQNCSG